MRSDECHSAEAALDHVEPSGGAAGAVYPGGVRSAGRSTTMSSSGVGACAWPGAAREYAAYRSAPTCANPGAAGGLADTTAPVT